MNFKEIQDLVKLINKTDLAEFKMKDGEFEISIRTKKFMKNAGIQTVASPQMISMPAVQSSMPMPAQEAAPAPVAAATPAAEETANTSNLLEIKSPMVGTFYRSAGPDKPVFAKVGDSINVGDTVCIVEAMKLFNEIESEITGKVVKVLVEDASPVEYDQVLFLVDPKG